MCGDCLHAFVIAPIADVDINDIRMVPQTREEKQLFKSGTTSTKKPRFDLIPHAGLIHAANRFELGLSKHGDKAWNALSPNQDALYDIEWLIARASHGIDHCYNMIRRLSTANFEGDDDAGAIAWCGLVLSAAWDRLKK